MAITPWPVQVRLNSSALISGMNHFTLAGCKQSLGSFPVGMSQGGLGKIIENGHVEKAGIVDQVLGDVSTDDGTILMNMQNTATADSSTVTGFLLSNQGGVKNLVAFNNGGGATGAGGQPNNEWYDLNNSNIATSDVQGKVTAYMTDDNAQVAFSIFNPASSGLGNVLSNMRTGTASV